MRTYISTALLALLTLGLIGYWITSGIESSIDITGADESGYLIWGIKGVLAPTRGPAYGLWYRFLSIFILDNTTLYYLNHRLMIVLPCLAFFVLLYQSHIKVGGALAVSWLLLCSIGNMQVWPKVSSFGCLVLIATALIARVATTHEKRCVILALGALIGTLVRPEFIVVFAIMSLYLLLKSINSREALLAFLLICTISTPLAISFNNARNSSSQDRLGEAFYQHFAYRKVKQDRLEIDPWTDFQQVKQSHFGQAQGLVSCFLANPHEVLKHVVANTIAVPGVFATWITPRLALTTGWVAPWLLNSFAILLSCVIFLASRNRTVKLSTEERIFWVAVLAIGLGPIIIIYPRAHYFQSVLVSLIILMPSNFSLNLSTKLEKPILGTFLVLAVATIPYLGFAQKDTKLPVATTIRYLNSCKFARAPILLDPDSSHLAYVPSLQKAFAAKSKTTPFTEILNSYQIDLVLVTKDLISNTRYQNDQSFKKFISSPERYGFERKDIPETNRYLLIDKSLEADCD